MLLGRRPDLQHILLSCENTNVALPYIDLVNEILEYYIVHGSLAGTPATTARRCRRRPTCSPTRSSSLDAAYDETQAEVYPYGLPFDMPLAHLRLLFEVWDTTLRTR